MLRSKSKKLASKRFDSWFWILVAALVVFASLAIYNFYPKIFCANSISCIKDLTGEFEDGVKVAEFMGEKMLPPDFVAEAKAKPVLGEMEGEKRIEVDLSTQTLYAYRNNQLELSFPISSGKWSHTPTGIYKIWIKLRYTRMSGGTPGTGTYYNLPNVPYTMFMYNDEHPMAEGYSLHGAYWHENFGHPMSHGCVNIHPDDAKKLYEWANPVSTANTTYASDENPGTVVVIYGETPKE